MNYDTIRQLCSEALATIALTLEALESYERLPVPSNQMGLEVQISGTEIRLQNLANELRKQLLG